MTQAEDYDTKYIRTMKVIFYNNVKISKIP